MQRGHEDADEGQDRERHQRQEQGPACPELAASNLHCVTLPVQPLDREDDHDDQDHEHDGQSRRQAHRSLGERKDVDLDPGDRRRVARPAGRRDVDDVKRGERGDHRDGQAHADLVSEKRDGDRDELPEPARTIDPGGLIQGGVDLGHARLEQDGAESQQHPDSDDANGRECPVEVAEPGTGDRAEPDGLEDLVDQAREGQQPAPDDAGSDERDDLGQEQNGPGYRSEPPGRHTVDHARDDETEAHRNEAEPHDQPERVEDRPDQVGNLEDSHVVLQSDPGHGTDAVPVIERILDGQQERQRARRPRTSTARAKRTASQQWSPGGPSC